MISIPAASFIEVPPFLSMEVLGERTEELRRRCGWDGSTVVDVESMMDVGLGLNIVPDPDMKQRTDAVGFLSADRTTVYVHDYVHKHLNHLLRFTLAHELGHYELHKYLYDMGLFHTPEQWRQLVNSMQPKARTRFEWQADRFAELFLVPGANLKLAVRAAQRRVKGPFTVVELADEEDRFGIVAELARRFQVAPSVIERRGTAEKLW
jgi:Zn-dependent peptidase ImmA (M78 family)